MSIIKRGHSYLIQIVNKDDFFGTGKKFYSETISGTNKKPASKKIADARKAELLRIIKNGDKPANYENYKINKLLDLWLESCKAKATYNDYSSMAEHHIRPVIGSISIKNLNGQHISKMVNRSSIMRYNRKTKVMVEDPDNPPKTRNAEAAVQYLNTCLNWHVEEENIIRNPVKGHKSKSKLPESDYIERPYMTHQEANSIIEYATQENATYGLVMYVLTVTGMRRGEVAGLTWRHIDDQTLEIHITQQINSEREIRPPKNRKARKISMAPTLAKKFREYRESREEYYAKLGRVLDEDEFVFINPKTDTYYNPGTFSDAFTRAKSRANKQNNKKKKVRDILVLHDFRHYHASTLMKSPYCNPKMVSVRLGHASVEFTYQRYGRLMAGDDKDAATYAIKQLENVPVLSEA